MSYSQVVGSLTITVAHQSDGPDLYGEDRQTYAYTITHGKRTQEGADLHTGVGLYSDERTMFATLCAFLEAYAEAYQANHLSYNESYSDVPAWLQEACYLNSEELTVALELARKPPCNGIHATVAHGGSVAHVRPVGQA